MLGGERGCTLTELQQAVTDSVEAGGDAAQSDAQHAQDELAAGIPVDVNDNGPLERRELVFLLGLTALAALLRLFRLDTWSFWVDEAHTLRDVAASSDLFWHTHVSNYPVSYLLLRGVLDWLPELSEGWLRLPYAFAGILAVPLLAMVGRSIIGTRGALLAALFLAVNPWHIYWSQNARAYAVLLPFVIGAAGLFWTGLQRGRAGWYLGGIAMMSLAGLTHPSAYLLFSLFAVVAFLSVWTRPGAYRPGILVWSGVIVVGILAIAFAFAQEHLQWVLQAKSDPSLPHFVKTAAFWFRPTLCIAAVLGFLALRHGPQRPGALYLGIWAFLPVAILALFVGAGVFQATAYYVFGCLPAFCLLAGAACHEVSVRVRAAGSRRWGLRLAVPAILVVEMLAYDALYFTTQYGDRPRWREATESITANPLVDKIVLTSNEPSMLFYLHPEFFWGASREAGNIEVWSIERWGEYGVDLLGGGVGYMDFWRDQAEVSGRQLFVVITEPELAEKDSDGVIAGWLRENARQADRLPCWSGPKDMTVFVYAVPPRR